jgi:hypothetical protein
MARGELRQSTRFGMIGEADHRRRAVSPQPDGANAIER